MKKKKQSNLIEGRFQGSAEKYGFVIPDNPDLPDIFIPPHKKNSAIDKDRVIVRYRVSPYGHGQRNLEGEIHRILNRANETIVGTFQTYRQSGFVVPDNSRINEDIYIPVKKTHNAVSGQKVVARITKWPERQRLAEGEIIEILGYPHESNVSITALIRELNLRDEFTSRVKAEAKSLSKEIPAEEIPARVDLRELPIVTVDGEDAKDFDDAINIKKLPDGCYELGVHIADVSYYVKENSTLDMEAFERGTSVYLVDRVLPMLPYELSNDICSLKEKEDRLALSIVMIINNNGNVIKYEIFKSIINVKKRLTYNYVARELDDSKNCPAEFKLMKELTLILYEKRKRMGSLDFDFPESKVILSRDGSPVKIIIIKRNVAHKIIEEFMLIANETIAKYMASLKVPFVYRIHETPAVDEIQKFLTAANAFVKVPLKVKKTVKPEMLQRISMEIKGKQEERLISTLMLRSLKLAIYSSVNKGHFGLAKEFYTHFTSPIRRYPDLIVHRLVKEVIKDKKINRSSMDKWHRILPEICRHSSEMERLAEKAENESEKLKKIEFIQDKIGNIYPGTISGVSNTGVFVELDNFLIDGLIPINSLPSDDYKYSQDSYSLIGITRKRVFKLGDKVKVTISKVNITKRQLDFLLV